MKKESSLRIEDIHACTICEAEFPLGPRPAGQPHPKAFIFIAAQASGKKIMESASHSMTQVGTACENS